MKRKLKRYDYVVAVYGQVQEDMLGGSSSIRRVLRKLVRDAVIISWHRAGDETTEALGSRIADCLRWCSDER